MKPLIIAPAARIDLRKIGDYIADDNPDRAVSFVQELEARVRQAGERPTSFPLRTDLGQGLRAITHKRYIIVYRNLPEQVRIVRILHTARNLPKLFRR